MAELKTCPKCAAELPENAPAGICPKCLMQAGLASEQDGGSSPHLKPTTLASRFVPPEPEELAKHFPQLEILELLGKGGMGAVYKARQPGLDRFVAVKILPPEVGADPAFAERFTREARALAKLSHQNIVSVFDSGRADGLYYFIMEFMDGTNLRQLIETGGLKPEEALAIVPQICEALQFAHNEGIVHRDIKPENILVDKQGRVKIADFGLAKLLGKAPADVTLTGTQQVMGTLHYMAPEQMRGAGAVDHRADIYSLGVVFYELLTGELPMGRFAPPSKRVVVDVRLDEIVLRTLEQNPEQRYQHAGDVKTDVEIISRSRQPGSPAHPESAKGLATGPQLVQAPADCLLLAAGIAFATACGVAAWMLAVPQYSSGHFTNSMIRGDLIGMSVTLAVYSVFIGVAGLMLRGLRVRLVVLLIAVIVGLFFPAVVALNVVMEHRNIPVWPVVIPLWLGMPAALWVVVTLFRADVRRAFDAVAGQRAEKPESDPVSLPLAALATSRPKLVPVLATFNLVGAIVLMLACAMEEPAEFAKPLPRLWQVWERVDAVLGFVMAAGMFAASIGLFLWKPWARKLTLVVCVFGLASLVFDAPYLARTALPELYAEIQQTVIAEGVEPDLRDFVTLSTFVVLFGGILAVGLTWLIGQLIYFNRPQVVAAFGPPAKNPNTFIEWLFTGTGAVVGVLSVFGPLALLLGLAALFNGLGGDQSVAPVPAAVPRLGTITSGIGAEFTVPAGQVAVFEIVTRRDNETVPVPPHCGYVMASPDSPIVGTLRWSPMPEEDVSGGRGRTWSLEIVTDSAGSGYTEALLLPDELNAAVGARSLGLGVLAPNEELIHWGIHDVRDLPANGLIGFRVTVVPHGTKGSGSGNAHIDWKKAQSAQSTTRRKLPEAAP